MNPWNIIGWSVLGVICIIVGLILIVLCGAMLETTNEYWRYYRKYRTTRYEPFRNGQTWIGKNKMVRGLRLLTAPSIYVSGEDTIYGEITTKCCPSLARIFTHDQLRAYIKKHKLHLA